MNGFDANSRLPGLGVSAGPLPPLPFPFMGPLTPSQFPPPPFPPFQMPMLGYPPMPMPTGPFQPQQLPQSTNENLSNRAAGVPDTMPPQTDNSAKPRMDYDQEEGEVTDGEGKRFTGPENANMSERAESVYTPPGVNGHTESPMITKMPTAHGPTRNLQQPDITSFNNLETAMSDAEEGEAFSVSHPSSRASGSRMVPIYSLCHRTTN